MSKAKLDDSFFVCRSCRKRIQPVNGRLKCCGFNDDAKMVIKSERLMGRLMTRKINKTLFSEPVFDHYDDETNEVDYEGIPNT